MFVIVIFSLLLTIWAQFKVRSAFNYWSSVASTSNLTGAQIARNILDIHDLTNVVVEPIEGSLSDHYDPTTFTVRLSEDVYNSTSISAISVAAHECGHAIQHKEAYAALVLRHHLVPILNITSGIAPFLIFAGFIFHAANLLLLGIIFFSATVFFHLVTLPVEFNASSRAKKIMLEHGFVTKDELVGVKKVLNAAAFTYVASALVALLELLRFIFLFLQQED